MTFSSVVKISTGISIRIPWTPHCPYCLASGPDPKIGLEAPTTMLRFPIPDKSVDTVRSARQSVLCHDLGRTTVMSEKWPRPVVVSNNWRDVDVRTVWIRRRKKGTLLLCIFDFPSRSTNSKSDLPYLLFSIDAGRDFLCRGPFTNLRSTRTKISIPPMSWLCQSISRFNSNSNFAVARSCKMVKHSQVERTKRNEGFLHCQYCHQPFFPLPPPQNDRAIKE